MSSRNWVKKQSLFCDRRRQTVHLLEERVYPGNAIPDVGRPFQVRAQKCSVGIECNILGHRCRWSGLNPLNDPFFEIEAINRR